jgi:hypothetical protein
MLEGNIFTSGGHGSSGGKRVLLLVLAVGGVVAVSLAAGGVGGVVDSVSGQGGTASAGAVSGSAAPAFPGMAAGFVLLLVGMLTVILRM